LLSLPPIKVKSTILNENLRRKFALIKSRRGWGEFPARIQIHFRNPLDQPVDIVHNLKLDKTHTGKQTLGAETHVDVWIHSSIKENREKLSPMVSPVKGFAVVNGLERGSPAYKGHSQKRNPVRTLNFFLFCSPLIDHFEPLTAP
jgi:hypothetical protein